MKRETGQFKIIRTYKDTNVGIDELLTALNSNWEIEEATGSGEFIEYILWNFTK